MATITYGTSQPIRVLIPVETAYCVRSVLSSLELLSEEYPAPVCDKCRLPMWTRRRVLMQLMTMKTYVAVLSVATVGQPSPFRQTKTLSNISGHLSYHSPDN